LCTAGVSSTRNRLSATASAMTLAAIFFTLKFAWRKFLVLLVTPNLRNQLVVNISYAAIDYCLAFVSTVLPTMFAPGFGIARAG
jgi:hypothetical protein